MNTKNHVNEFALITGSSRGIGFAMVREMLYRGYSVIGVSRKTEKIKNLALSFPKQKIITFNYDLTETGACQKLFAATKSFNITVVINNAGSASYGGFNNLPVDQVTREFDLNARVLFLLTHLFYRRLTASKVKGKIINVSSIIAFLPAPFFTTYYATKEFILRFTHVLNLESFAQRENTHLSVICPGQVSTRLLKNFSSNISPKQAFVMRPDQLARKGLRKALRHRRKAPVIIGWYN